MPSPCVLPLLASLLVTAEPTYQPRHERDWPRLVEHVRQLWAHAPQMKVEGDLPHPHVIPILFYWDMYFMNRGLALAGRADLARKVTENLLAEVDRHGFVPNASAAWGTDRSHVPFLSMIVRDVWEGTPAAQRDRAWLLRAYRLLRREYDFWTDAGATPLERHATTIPGLARYGHHMTEHALLALYDDSVAPRLGLAKTITREEKLAIAANRIAEAVSGWDFTPRFEGRALSFAPVELNTNLWVYETNFAHFAAELGLEGEPDWQARARARKQAIDTYLWNPERGVYLDYDFVLGRPGRVACAVTFWPLWAGLASHEQARAVAANLHRFEQAQGFGACEPTPADLRTPRSPQWDHDAAWPHLHPIAVLGLARHGLHADARRIAAKFLDNQTKNFLAPEPRTVRTTAEFAGKRGAMPAKAGKTWEKFRADKAALDTDEYGVNECLQTSPGATMILHDYLETSRASAALGR